MRTDTERLDWLQKNGPELAITIMDSKSWLFFDEDEIEAPTLRAAIDAAMDAACGQQLDNNPGVLSCVLPQGHRGDHKSDTGTCWPNAVLNPQTP